MFEYAKCGPVTRTVSVCFRKSLIDPYIQYAGMGNDMVLQTILAKQSLFAKHSENMCVYRRGGVSNTQSIDKELYYNRWYVENRLLQKRLFPEDCNWDDDEISDQRYFSLMRYYIRHFQYKKTIELRKKIRSKKFKEKRSYRYSGNLISSFILGLAETIGVIFNNK